MPVAIDRSGLEDLMLRLHVEEAPALTIAPTAQLLLDSHDDCYLYAEARDRAFLDAVVARMLRLFAESVVSRDGGEATIQDAEPVAARLVEPDVAWTASAAAARRRDGFVEVPLCQAPWSLADVMPTRVDAVLVYDIAAGIWNWSAGT